MKRHNLQDATTDHVNKASHLTCLSYMKEQNCVSTSPGPLTAADEAWYWSKHVLRRGRLT